MGGEAGEKEQRGLVYLISFFFASSGVIEAGGETHTGPSGLKALTVSLRISWETPGKQRDFCE